MPRKKAKTTKSRYIPAIWKQEILRRQRQKCAGKECVKLSGKKAPVNIMSNFDHIRPVGMNGANQPSNIQVLCPTCHAYKTRKDRYRIAQWKKKQGKKPVRKKPRRRKKETDIFGLSKIKLLKPPKIKF